MSTSYVPPSYDPSMPPARRSGPGCWVWGFATCLVVVVIGVIVAAVAFNQVFKSPAGKKLAGSFGGMMQGAQDNAACIAKMKTVYNAVIQYHSTTGKYPAKLTDLRSQYLTDPTALHCDMDSNTDPTHVTYSYTKPSSNAPGTTPILSIHWTYAMDLGSQRSTNITTTTSMLLNGSLTTSQTQNTTISTGATGGMPGFSPTPPPPPPPPIH